MGTIGLMSCQDNIALFDERHNTQESVNERRKGMQRIVASSPTEIEQLIAQMGDGSKPMTRAISSATLSDNEEVSCLL